MPADDVPVVEYISVTAAVSLVALTLGGQLGDRLAVLPTSTATAIQLVTAGARAQRVPVSGARAAYARAPYKKPVLRYLYAAGWIGGMKHQRSCILTRLVPETAEEQAANEIRRSVKLRIQLRKRGVTARTASAALVKGVVSACG